MRNGNQAQEAPTGLAGVAPTSAANNDGKITGTTTAMEYKLASAEDTAYVTATETEVTGLAAGDYVVRLAAKEGFNASPTTAVTVAAFVAQNQAQEAPTGLAGVAPTSAANNDGKITGTTTAMEYKLASAEDTAYVTATETEVTGLAAGDYVVRLAAKEGFNASPTTAVTVGAYVAPIVEKTSDTFTLVAENNTVTITLTDGTFKAGEIVAGDFTFEGTDATALEEGTFTRVSDTVVTIKGLSGLSGTDNTVTVKAATQATQASSVAAVASTEI